MKNTIILGLAAGFLILLVSGNGLFSFVGLLFFGLPPHVAIATNRMGGIGLWPPVIWKYAKKGLMNWKYVVPLSILWIVGATIGAQIVLAIPEDILKFIVSILISFVLALSYSNKELGVVHKNISRSSKKIGFAGFFGSNIYAGFFRVWAGSVCRLFLNEIFRRRHFVNPCFYLLFSYTQLFYGIQRVY